MKKLFTGTYTAIITPFDQNNRVDWQALQRLVDMQANGGVDGIVFVGTTGESPTLKHDEHYEILRRAKEMVRGRCKVIHGTGSNDTDHALNSGRVAAESQADGQLVVNPYYNKPTQEGLYRHFMTLADATTVPIIVYNIKGRTGVNIETPTMLKLAQHPNIVAVKEASGDVNQMLDVMQQAPADFSVLVGDDGLTLPFMGAGGDGVVSVVSNVMPRAMSEFIRTCLAGDFAKARTQFFAMYDVMKIAFVESNPIPVKEMLALLGYCRPDLRLPLCRATDKSMEQIRRAVDIIKHVEKV